VFTLEMRRQKKPEEASVRLYHRIFPLEKGEQKNPGITATGRFFCIRSDPA
jgi:hypothetical protein